MEFLIQKGFQKKDDEASIKLLEGLCYETNKPFDPKIIAALSDLSKKLLRSPAALEAPQLVSLGFWLRSSQLNLAASRFDEKVPKGAYAKARGIALHLPPQNVDTLFVYSWALSFLSGNVNVTRLPSEISNVLTWLLNAIVETLDTHNFSSTQLFCRYPHDSDMTARFSELADLRIIWGGDAKIKTISQMPIRPDGLSLGFSDRESFSIVSGHAYSMMSEFERDEVASKLYNDVFWFDQMGCGSPRVLFWIGEDSRSAKDLYNRLDNVAAKKSYSIETGIILSKFSYLNDSIASEHAVSCTWFSDRLSVLHSEINPAVLNKHQGAGLLYDVTINKISDVKTFLNPRTQTVTHLGLSEKDIKALSSLMLARGGYRLVPVGEALSFSDIWDGIDLINNMIRLVTVRS